MVTLNDGSVKSIKDVEKLNFTKKTSSKKSVNNVKPIKGRQTEKGSY